MPGQAPKVIDSSAVSSSAATSSATSRAPPALAGLDWALHLAASPAKRMELARLALEQAAQLVRYAGAAVSGPTEAPVVDRRFGAPEWQRWPFNLLHQSFLLGEQWWSTATHDVSGVQPHDADLVAFYTRQWLDVFSPANQFVSNPVVLKHTADQGGVNLLRGALNLADDLRRQATGAPMAGTESFAVGRDVAVTPGKVVLRNRLMELIQYTPATGTVHPEPILILPAWIMKYYILDLAPEDSLIAYLVGKGHTVFCVSWKNPHADERDLGMDDYLRLGLFDALDAVGAIVPDARIHATGYCLGGTLLAIGAAALARDGDRRLASLTLLAAQTDFSEPGQLGLFIDEQQIRLLEARMARTGTMGGEQMAGAFQLLHANELLWAPLVDHYLLGERQALSDLMAWNADATRLPATMHSQYLRRLYLDNELSTGRYPVGGKPISLADITQPCFMVGTVTDHVAPWRSVYKLHGLSPAEISFVLTSGGHNAGIVSPPGHLHRHYQALTRPARAPALDPDAWLAAAPQVEGSWWPAWQQWLAAHSGEPVAPPPMGAGAYQPVCDAPGSYVLER